MIGQAIFIVVFLVLAVMSLFAAQYCFDHDWAAPCAGVVFIAGLFVVAALVTLVILGEQVWS